MTIKVAITSGKGGVGKTTTVANLGLALARIGVDVTIVDANFTTPDLSMHFGSPATDKTIHHVLSGDARLLDAVHLHPTGLKIVPASISLDDLERINYNNVPHIADRIPGEVVLFDTAAGLGPEMRSVVGAVDKTIIVTNPEWPAITDALKAAIVSESLNVPVDGIILNKTKIDRNEPDTSSVEAILDAPVLATIPYDKSIRRSISTKNPVVISSPNSRAAEAYTKLAHDLIGKAYKPKRFSLKRMWSRVVA